MKKILLFSFALWGSATMLFAQDKTVTGIVTSGDDGTALPGVNVVVKGTATGTITDMNGAYSLTVPPESILVYSFVGYASQEVEVGSQTKIDLALYSDVTQLSEVIVTAYGTTTRKDNTGALSTLKTDDIKDVPAVSFQNTLQGNVTGVQVGSTSGQPGSFPDVNIRGIGSINASTNPLYVIDGIPVFSGDFSSFTTSSSNILSTLNPNDIEEITVLKDASSAALYGARGANGVIIITTKKGQSGKTNFQFKTSHGVTDFAMKDIGHWIADGPATSEINREGLFNYFRYIAGQSEEDANNNADIFNEQFYPIPSAGYTDWEDILFRQGKISTYELSASGGSDKTTFFISGGIHQEDAIVRQSGFERYTFRTNIDHSATEKLRFGINTNVAYTKQDRVPDQGLYYANPWTSFLISYSPLDSVYDQNGDLMPNVKNQFPNPLYERDRTEQFTKTTLAQISPYIEYDIKPWLSFRTNNRLEYNLVEDYQYWSPSSNDGGALGGSGYNARNMSTNLTTSNILTFSNTFATDHNVKALLVAEVNKRKYENMTASVSGFPNDVLKDFATAANKDGVTRNESEDNLISYMAKLDYNYKNKYYIGGHVRRDGSSRMSAENRWGTFWSVSGAWVVSAESFMDNVPVLSELKIRSSYGTSAIYPSDLNGAPALYGFTAQYNGQTAAFPSQLANPNLSWETNKTFDVGLEFGLFENRIFTTFDVYSRTTEDLLDNARIPRTTGFGTILKNIGEISNKGWELSITSRNIDNGNFSWSTTFTASHNSNKIEKLYNGTDQFPFPNIYREGHSINTYFMREAAGVDPETGQWMWYKNTTDEDGNVISGRETTTNSAEAEKVINGKWDPDMVGGLRNTLSYKGIELSFLVNYVFGGLTYDDYAFYGLNDGAFPNQGIMRAQLDRWTAPGMSGASPMRVYGGGSNSNFNSDRRLHSGTYVRLKDITLGYNIPANLVSKIGLANARLFFNGTNLWTWAKDDMYDPEVRNGGSVGTNLPPIKSYVFGLQFNF